MAESSQNQDKFVVRLPDGMRDWIKSAADKNNRSMNSEIVARLNVPRRSTLIVLRGDQELGRVVANPRREDIKALMDLGLPTS